MTLSHIVDLPGGAVAEIPTTVAEVDGVYIHQNRAEQRTIENWRTKPVHAAIREAIAEEAQEAENMMWGVLWALAIDLAFGASLDKIGRIVGEGRRGRDDPNYRVRLRARIAINQSLGRPGDILNMLQILGVTEAHLTELGFASFLIRMPAVPPTSATLAEIPGLISECRAVGIGVGTISATSAAGFTFKHAGDADDPTLGFSDFIDPDPDVGGTLADGRRS